MHTVERRVFDTDAEGRRFLLYRPGDVVTNAEAKRAATLVESKPERPGVGLLLERPDTPAVETPIKPLDRMKRDELRAVCAAEGFDPAGANLRAEFVAIIEAGRAAAGAQIPASER